MGKRKKIKKIDLMHKLFGRSDAGICKCCEHYKRFRYHDKPYRKCSIYGDSNSEATDWCGKYPACGLFPDKPYKGNKEVYQLYFPEEEQPIEGQTSLFER